MLMGSPPKINSMSTQVELGKQGEERRSGEEEHWREGEGKDRSWVDRVSMAKWLFMVWPQMDRWTDLE